MDGAVPNGRGGSVVFSFVLSPSSAGVSNMYNDLTEGGEGEVEG
jgi:hypothetical protein